MPVPLISSLIALPLVGAVLLLFINNRDNRNEARGARVRTGLSVAELALTLVLWRGSTMPQPTSSSWSGTPEIPRVRNRVCRGCGWDQSVSGRVTAFLTPLSLLSSWGRRARSSAGVLDLHARARERDDWCLCLDRSLPVLYVLGRHARADVLLIGVWGTSDAYYAAVKFMLYTMAGACSC